MRLRISAHNRTYQETALTESTSWFGFDDLFWLTLLVLFGSALLGALLRRFRRDRCLGLFNDHHITYLNAKGQPRWGDLYVSNRGLELTFDAPFLTSRGITKTSHLVLADGLSKALALCRTPYALTDEERRERERQIERTFQLGLVALSVRRLRNFADMLRDALGQSLSMVIGAVGGRMGTALNARKGDMSELSKTLVSTVAAAYEPLLERHIGKPVVVECNCAPGAPMPTAEFAGYLVGYTADYLAIFSDDPQPTAEITLTSADKPAQSTSEVDVTDLTDDPSHATGPSYDVSRVRDRIQITCTGPDALVVRHVDDGDRHYDLDVSLLPGCVLGVRVTSTAPAQVQLETTHELDLICPRAGAVVRFGSGLGNSRSEGRSGWTGLSPEEA